MNYEMEPMSLEDARDAVADDAAIEAANRPWPYSDIDAKIIRAIDAWVQRGQVPGDFLQAVLRNNLADAVGLADDRNFENLGHIISYLYNDCPAHCWGSVAEVEAWKTKHRKGGA